MDNFSLVTSDVTIKLILILLLCNTWMSEMLEIETASLEKKLDKEIYMENPEG